MRRRDGRLFRNAVQDIDWTGKTLSAMQQIRWQRALDGMEEIRDGALMGLTYEQLRRRIEGAWQAVPCKPISAHQVAEALRVVLEALPRQVDCLAIREHTLIERLLVEGGQSELDDMDALDAALALRHRLWADVGLDRGRPVVRLDKRLLAPLAEALRRPEHTAVRMRLFAVHATISAMLYIAGALDDRAPQQLFAQQVLRAQPDDEEAQHLALQYLWASYDCIDYPGGVLIAHPALADPLGLIAQRYETGRDMPEVDAPQLLGGMQGVLPEEEPLDHLLAAALRGALRPSENADECVRELRWLVKQGAPLHALHAVLSPRLIVLETQEMRRALLRLWQDVPRWDGACAARMDAIQ